MGVALLSNLYNTYNGKTYRYNELPKAYRNAVDIYFKDEFEIPEKELDNRLYGCLSVPISIITDIIMSIDEYKDTYKTFEEYHQGYMLGGDVPKYSERLACILYEDEDFILDGWHRLHSYYQYKVDMIPCVFIIKR